MKNDPPRFAPRRPLGRTGFMATRLGIGDLADRSIPFDQCLATLTRAIEAGLNVLDTAPGYEEGYSEQLVGAAVRATPDREQLFVIDKIDHNDQPVAPQIDRSLQTLGLDHTDAFVFHGVSSLDLWHRLVAPGGGFDQLAEVITTGKTRFRGISSHHPDVVLAAIDSGLCDLLMFPVGAAVDPRYVEECLPRARAAGIGTVCFKTFAAGKLVADTSGYGRPLQPRPRGKFSSGTTTASTETDSSWKQLSVETCLRYTLTADPDVALLGLSYPNEQDPAFAAAMNFQPMTYEEMTQTHAAATAALKGKGPNWWNPDPTRWT